MTANKFSQALLFGRRNLEDKMAAGAAARAGQMVGRDSRGSLKSRGAGPRPGLNWVMSAVLALALGASGCASTSAGVGVGLGDGGKSSPGSDAGLAVNESGDFVEDAPAAVSAASTLAPSAVRNTHVLQTAFSQVGKPYRYGGTKPETGFDCSGFVRWVYGQYGVGLPRRSGDMMGVGASVARKDLKPGDLVFFGKRKTITHVGIYTGDNKYIHSPRSGKSVEESSLDDRGRGEYYVGARRLLQNPGASKISDSQKSAWAEQAGMSLAVAKASAPSETKPAAEKIAAAAPVSTPAKKADIVKKHKVKPGETFYKLARQYDIKPEILAKANKIGNYRTAVLKPGQTLLVPGREIETKAVAASASVESERPPVVLTDQAPIVALKAEAGPAGASREIADSTPTASPSKTIKHKITSGDTFYGIAQKYKVKSADLAKANNIDNIAKVVLKPGRTLIIPGREASAEPARMAELQETDQAAPAGQPAPKALVSSRSHTIKDGDTFYAVAQKYGVKAADLAKANNIEDINTAVLRPGKTLVIPSKASSAVSVASPAPAQKAGARRHKVENGDTFYGVAKKYGVKSADLAKANNIEDLKTAVLRPGQTLVVPPKAN